MVQTKLMHVEYKSDSPRVHLQNYSDVFVYASGTLIAIRLGGYPECVQGMSDAIYGGGEILITKESQTYKLKAPQKSLRRQHSANGVYAEAVLMPNDLLEYERIDDKSDENATRPQIKSKTCYLFCPKGDSDKLYEEIDKNISVPLLPEFKPYLLKKLVSKRILSQLKVVGTDEFEAWALKLNKDDLCVVSIINEGLQSGLISIPHADKNDSYFQDVESVTQYLNKFGVLLADRIQNQFVPLFNPATQHICSELETIDKYICDNTGYSLYDAQLAVAEAAKRRLETNRPALIVAECGSGKTKIGAAAMGAYQLSKGKEKTINIVMCPAHVTEKWVREIDETLPNTKAVIIHDITELKKVHTAYCDGTNSVVAIINKERARDGYMKYPAVVRRKAKKVFVCPDCGKVIQMPVVLDGNFSYMIDADGTFFLKENSKNHKCAHCGSVLWAPLVSSKLCSGWTKIGGYGFVYKPHIFRYTTNDENIKNILLKIAEGEELPVKGTFRRYSLSTYIKKKMQGCFDTLIADELHEYNNDSGQGDAMAEIFNSCKNFIGMTATLMNGYATGIFNLLYRLMPHYMKLDYKNYSSLHDFAREYGVIESTFTISETNYQSNRRTQIRKKSERVKPGISPLVYTRFLLESAVFLSLMDMGKDLPEYEEIPIELSMSENVLAEYNRIRTAIKKVMLKDPKVGNKIRSAYMNLLTVYPDQPYDHKPIINPFNGDIIVEPQNMGEYKTSSEKDLKVLQLVKSKVDAGENVLIYTSWIRIDSQKKLSELLENEGISCATLRANIKPANRESWMLNQMEKGVRVLITNPTLVQTGLDLNMFTTLIFYNINYSLFTLRQASKRSWRISQTALRIEVYFFYFDHSMQKSAMYLMAQKLSVASLIEGHFSDEGLAAMGESDDLTSKLAKELTQELKNIGSEDIADAFKKMAILHPERKISDNNKLTSMEEKNNRSCNFKPVVTLFSEVKQMSFFDVA